jgi:hypothetical protein
MFLPRAGFLSKRNQPPIRMFDERLRWTFFGLHGGGSVRFSASWAIAVVAIFLAAPEAANAQAPANPAGSAPPSYAAFEESACEPGAPRLLGPVIHARPIAEAEIEESSLLRSEAGPSVTPLGANVPVSDHLFGGLWSPEAMPLDERGLTFDEVLPAEHIGLSTAETSLLLDITTGNDFFLHAGADCGAMAGDIRFQGEN